MATVGYFKTLAREIAGDGITVNTIATGKFATQRLAENYGSALVGSQWKDVVAFVLLILILLFRPTGLLGESLGKARA